MVNIIGLMIPKIISLLAILIPSISSESKILLCLIWFITLLTDYDIARPAHNGNIYKLTKNASYEIGELVAQCIRLVPASIFLALTIMTKAWIPIVVGAISVFATLQAIFLCLKNLLDEKKRRRERNATSNYK